MSKLFILCTFVFQSMVVFAETDYNRVYELIERKCQSGTLNLNASPLKEGMTFTRDFFNVDPGNIRQALDNANWENVELEYSVNGSLETICDNSNRPTKLIFLVKRLR